MKEYVYDTASGRGAGKLAQATRHNYVTLPWNATETDAWVTDLYDYSGTAGAPSAKTTSFARGPYQYTSAYAYTDGGAIGSVTYPTCDAGFACPGTPEPARTVSYTYEQGLLRQVPGWTNTITYHPSGAWNQMPRVNTVTDGRDSDPASPDRLNRFHASSPSTGASWDSGTMAYDGSGNLKSIGADKYTYDQSSRLLSGTAGGERQDYTYDAFGNITQIAHTDGGGGVTTRSIGVVPSTNRLSVATYDAAGNLTSWAGNTYTWDALGSLVQFNGGQNGGGTYLYDVEDRRVAVLKSPDNTEAAKRRDPQIHPPRAQRELRRLRRRLGLHAGQVLLPAPGEVPQLRPGKGTGGAVADAEPVRLRVGEPGAVQRSRWEGSGRSRGRLRG